MPSATPATPSSSSSSSALQSVARAEARPEFVSDLRERLMLAAEAELVGAGLPRSPG